MDLLNKGIAKIKTTIAIKYPSVFETWLLGTKRQQEGKKRKKISAVVNTSCEEGKELLAFTEKMYANFVLARISIWNNFKMEGVHALQVVKESPLYDMFLHMRETGALESYRTTTISAFDYNEWGKKNSELYKWLKDVVGARHHYFELVEQNRLLSRTMLNQFMMPCGGEYNITKRGYSHNIPFALCDYFEYAEDYFFSKIVPAVVDSYHTVFNETCRDLSLPPEAIKIAKEYYNMPTCAKIFSYILDEYKYKTSPASQNCIEKEMAQYNRHLPIYSQCDDKELFRLFDKMNAFGLFRNKNVLIEPNIFDQKLVKDFDIVDSVIDIFYNAYAAFHKNDNLFDNDELYKKLYGKKQTPLLYEETDDKYWIIANYDVYCETLDLSVHLFETKSENRASNVFSVLSFYMKKEGVEGKYNYLKYLDALKTL